MSHIDNLPDRDARPLLQKWEAPSRFDRKKAQKAEAERIEREVYAAVTTRDGSSCRACGVYCRPSAVGLLEKAHHHHIVYRSAGGATSTANVCLLCAQCHDDEHRHRISVEGNADVALTVYRLPQHDGDTGYIKRQEVAPHQVVRD